MQECVEGEIPLELKKTSHRFSFLYAAVLSCFFLSGVAGLIYQVLWVRMIDKVIGSAPFAVATVLAIFMGGLALGSYLAGKHVDRVKSKGSLLAIYGVVEVVIGLYGLILPFFMTAAKIPYTAAYNSLFEHFWLYQLFSFFGCSVLLIAPTTLMGVTLPVLCRFYVAELGHLGTRTGRLYGLNTIGAAVGALLCGFYLISALGMWGTLFTAAGINFFVGGACLVLGKKFMSCAGADRDCGTQNAPEKEQQPQPEPPAAPDGTTTWALWIFAASGFCAMAYEVVWTRLLGLILGPTTYSFTLVVSTFIVGLALGSVLFGWIADRSRRVFFLLAFTQLCASVLALAVGQFLGNSQFFFSKLIYAFHGDFGKLMIVQSMVLFAILLGPTVFLGATFPLVNRIYARALPVLGQSIGTAYALNTIGAILGSFAAGFILIPHLGKESSLAVVFALQFGVALLALMAIGLKIRQKKRQWLLCGVAAVAGLFLVVHFPSWNRNILARGWYRDFNDVGRYLKKTSWMDALWKGASILDKLQSDLELVYYGDGVGGFTTVEKEISSAGTVLYSLANSGKPDASSHGDRATQVLLAHIPMLFHPNPETVMVLGLASGMTPGEVLYYPVKRLDVLEISEQVAEACKLFFTPWNNDCLSNPKTRLILQDGRNHLALTSEKYDVIISEPSNPWMAGLANLFSLEFFETVKDRLKEDGIFAQWIHSYEMDWETFAIVGRTFHAVFPKGILMKTAEGDYLLLGFSQDRGPDWQIPEKNIQYARHSSNVTLRNAGFLVHFVITEDLDRFFETGPLHTDNWPRLEFAAPKQLYGEDFVFDDAITSRCRLSAATHQALESNSDADTFLDLVEFAASAYSPLFGMVSFEGLARSQMDRYDKIIGRYCDEVLVPNYEMLPTIETRQRCAVVQIDKIRHRIAQDDSRASDYFNLSVAHVAAGHMEEAVEDLRKVISMDPLYAYAHKNLGVLLADSSKLAEAAEYFARAAEMDPQDAETYKTLGIIQLELGKTADAATSLIKAVELRPDDVDALNKLGVAFLEEKRFEEAIEKLSTAALIDPENAEARNTLGAAFYRQGRFEEAKEHFESALRIDPGNQNIRNNLDAVLRHMGGQGGT